MFSRINFLRMPHEGWMKINSSFNQKWMKLQALPGGLSFFNFLWWLLYSDVIISNMYVHVHNHFFITHVLFKVGVFVICMLPLPYSTNCLVFFILQSFCEIIMTLSSIQLPSLIAPSSLSHCAMGNNLG